MSASDFSPTNTDSSEPGASTSSSVTGIISGKRERKRKELPEFVVSSPPGRKRNRTEPKAGKTSTGRSGPKLGKRKSQGYFLMFMS